MKKRLFIAINLSESLKKKMGVSLEKIQPLFYNEIRFLTPENWHITLVFLGYQEEEFLYPIFSAMKKIVNDYSAPIIKLENITYGPKGSTPRMIWLNGSVDTSEQLGKIKNTLENQLADQRVKFKREYRRFQAHITLARFQPMAREVLPKIEELFSANFQAVSLDLMESHLQRFGAQYEILQSVPLRLI